MDECLVQCAMAIAEEKRTADAAIHHIHCHIHTVGSACIQLGMFSLAGYVYVNFSSYMHSCDWRRVLTIIHIVQYRVEPV